MTSIKEYLIQEWEKGEHKCLQVVDEYGLFNILQEELEKEKSERRQIAIKKLPVDCIIDIS